MPLTPNHLGPGILFGIVFLSFLDLPTFLIASVIVDIEPILILLLGLDAPLHGFFHSFLGGTIIALILTGIMTLLRKLFTPVMSFFKLEQERSFIKILMASLLGIYIHILFDSLMHTDIKPFYPLDFNPFLGYASELGVSATRICEYSFLAGLTAYIIRLIIYYWRKQLRRIYMDPSNKFMLRGISLILVGIFFIFWGFSDILSVKSEIRIIIMILLFIMIPFIILAIIYDFIGIIKVIRKKKELDFLNVKNWIYNCAECGAKITLEVKVCDKCGVENAIRRAALESLENLEHSIEEKKAKILETQQSSKRKKSSRTKYTEELEAEILLRVNQLTKKAALIKKSLLIGNTRYEKIDWVRKQYYEKNKSIIEIADELGEDMFIVEAYINEIKNQEKDRNKQEDKHSFIM